jgi:hypothetical protein
MGTGFGLVSKLDVWMVAGGMPLQPKRVIEGLLRDFKLDTECLSNVVFVLSIRSVRCEHDYNLIEDYARSGSVAVNAFDSVDLFRRVRD